MAFDPEPGCRIALALLFVGAATIGLPFRLRADRAGGRVPIRVDPGWFWACMLMVGPLVLLGCLAFLIQPRWIDFAHMPLPPVARFAGIPLGLAGLSLFAWMFVHLGLNVTSTSMPRGGAFLVTSGPYRYIRHPMYTAAFVLGAATSLLTASWLVLVGGLGMFALLAARTRVEEERLVEKFGASYREYQMTTGRFLPRLRT